MFLDIKHFLILWNTQIHLLHSTVKWNLLLSFQIILMKHLTINNTRFPMLCVFLIFFNANRNTIDCLIINVFKRLGPGHCKDYWKIDKNSTNNGFQSNKGGIIPLSYWRISMCLRKVTASCYLLNSFWQWYKYIWTLQCIILVLFLCKYHTASSGNVVRVSAVGRMYLKL